MIHYSVDLETKSRVSLKDTGVSRYAGHESTDVLCMAFRRRGEKKVDLWLPGDPVPDMFHEKYRGEIVFRAWNAAFERAIFAYVMPIYGFRPMRIDEWFCTMAQAGYCNLPMKLDMCARTLGMKQEKDEEGHKVMMRVCKPYRAGKPVNGIYPDKPFKMSQADARKLYAYCQQDVRTEDEISEALPEFPAKERALWIIDQRINDLGIPIDRELCESAVTILDDFHVVNNAELADLTYDFATNTSEITATTQTQRIKKYLLDRNIDLPTKVNPKGKIVPSLGADDLEEWFEEHGHELPPDAFRVIELRMANTSSAVAKYSKILDVADSDDRCRGQFQYHKAGPGRWAGRGFQPQNMFRIEGPPPESWLDAIKTRSMDAVLAAAVHEQPKGDDRPHWNLLDILAYCTRSAICAPKGKKFVISDFSSVENRKLAWLAGDEHSLKLFREGHCQYCDMAASMPGCEMDAIYIEENYKTDPEAKRWRKKGKAPILGLGYQCGPDKFVSVSKKMGGLIITAQESEEIVRAYRDKYALNVQLWYDVQRAAIAAVDSGKRIRLSDKLWFYMEGDFLVIELPSGRQLRYYKPKVEFEGNRPSLTYVNNTGKREHTYGGKLVENIDQGSCRDLLVDVIFRLDRKGILPCMHVHDEIVPEVDEDDDKVETLIHAEMLTNPKWSVGMPMGAGTSSSKRYDK